MYTTATTNLSLVSTYSCGTHNLKMQCENLLVVPETNEWTELKPVEISVDFHIGCVVIIDELGVYNIDYEYLRYFDKNVSVTLNMDYINVPTSSSGGRWYANSIVVNGFNSIADKYTKEYNEQNTYSQDIVYRDGHNFGYGTHR